VLRFIGKHNQIKSLSWLLLSQFPNFDYLTIAALVGSSSCSMSVLLKRWHKWGYLTRSGRKGLYVYSITPLALTWLNRHLAEMPFDTWLAGLPAENQGYFAKVFQVWLQRRGEG